MDVIQNFEKKIINYFNYFGIVSSGIFREIIIWYKISKLLRVTDLFQVEFPSF